MRSGEMYPGDRLQHEDGKVVTLSRRKRPGDGHSTIPFHPGWWNDRWQRPGRPRHRRPREPLATVRRES